MSKKYLIVLKNPPVSFMVDSFDEKEFFHNVKSVSCIQEEMGLLIPINSSSNISYIQEMTEDDIVEMKERMEEMDKQKKEMRAKLLKVQPGFKIPSKKTH